MITLTDPLSITATLCNLSPGERAVLWPLPQTAYVVTEPMAPAAAEAYAPMMLIELYEAHEPAIAYDSIRAVDVYVQTDSGWSKVKGRGAHV